MSTYCSFMVEAKRGDSNEWKPLSMFSYEGGERKETIVLLCKNYPGFRDAINWRNTRLKDRGLPSDVSSEVKSYIEDDDNGCYGASYMSFSELSELIGDEENKELDSIKTYYTEKSNIPLLKGIVECIKTKDSSMFYRAVDNIGDNEWIHEEIEESTFILSSLNDIDCCLRYVCDLYDVSSYDSSRVRIVFFMQ